MKGRRWELKEPFSWSWEKSCAGQSTHVAFVNMNAGCRC